MSGNPSCEGCGRPALVRYGTHGVSRCQSLCRVCACYLAGWRDSAAQARDLLLFVLGLLAGAAAVGVAALLGSGVVP